MARARKVAVQGVLNLEIRFPFVEFNESTGNFEPVPIAAAFTPPGFAEATFQPPTGPPRNVTLVDVGEATSGVASYFTAAHFIDQVGTWQAQGAVFLPGAAAGQGFFPSRVVEFEVEELLRVYVPVATPDTIAVQVSLPEALVA